MWIPYARKEKEVKQKTTNLCHWFLDFQKFLKQNRSIIVDSLTCCFEKMANNNQSVMLSSFFSLSQIVYRCQVFNKIHYIILLNKTITCSFYAGVSQCSNLQLLMFLVFVNDICVMINMKFQIFSNEFVISIGRMSN